MSLFINEDSDLFSLEIDISIKKMQNADGIEDIQNIKYWNFTSTVEVKSYFKAA